MDRPTKRKDIAETVAERVRNDRIELSDHAVDKLTAEGVLELEVYEVLKSGVHVPEYDLFDEGYWSWNYAIKGVSETFEHELRVGVTFVEHDGALVVTVINLEK